MIELIVVACLAVAVAVAVETGHRRALRRARRRAEAVLDELATAACAAMAAGHDPSTSRRGARAIARYARADDRVRAARTRRELDALVVRHRLRTGAARTATRGLERVRDLLAETVPTRR